MQIGNAVCGDCEHATRLITEKPQLSIQVYQKGVLQYANRFLAEVKYAEIMGLRNIKLDNKSFQFLQVNYSGKPIFIHFNFEKPSNKTLAKMETLGIPIIFIGISKGTSNSNIESKLFGRLELVKILENEAEAPKMFEYAIANSLLFAVDRIDSAATASAQRLASGIGNPQQYEWADFQTDVLNIFKQIFPTAHKGATKYTPEGFVGISYKSPKKRSHTFEWDCKLGKTGPYDLPQSEKDKAWRYIRASLKVKELKNFSGKLSSYVIVSNSIDDDVFEDFAQSLKRKNSWKGRKNVVLFQADAILELHKQHARNQLEVLKRPNTFYTYFFKMFDNRAHSFVRISPENIKELFSTVASKPKEFGEMDWRKVVTRLQQDAD